MFNNYVLSYLHSWVGWQFAGSLRALFLLQTVRALKRRLRRMGSDLLVKAIAANTTPRWRKTTKPGKGVSLFSRIQPCYFLKRYKHNIGKSRPLFPKLMMNVRKKLGAFLSQKKTSTLKRNCPLESSKNLVLSYSHTSFLPEGWRYVGFHMFFWDPPQNPTWCECWWRRVSLWICPHPALSGLSGHVCCCDYARWRVSLCVLVYHVLIFVQLRILLMFILFGNDFSWKAFELVSPVFFTALWQVGKPEKIFPRLLSTDSVVLTQHLGTVEFVGISVHGKLAARTQTWSLGRCFSFLIGWCLGLRS